MNLHSWRVKIYYLKPKIYRCHCGRWRDEHVDIPLEERSIDIDDTHNLDNIHVEEVAWDPDQHLGRKETNAYGEIDFHMAGNKSKAKV